MVTTFAKKILTATMFLSVLILSGCSNDNDVQSPQIDQFQQFVYEFIGGGHLPGVDHSGFIDLASDGTLRYDKAFENPVGTVHTTKVTQADLDTVIPVLINARLVSLLDLPGEICSPTGGLERMTLTMAGESHSHEMTNCSDQSIEDARNVLRDLANRYFP